MVESIQALTYLPHDWVQPLFADLVVLVAWVALPVLGLGATLCLQRKWRRAARAFEARARADSGHLEPGPRIFSGRIIDSNEGGPTIAVTIVQQGDEWTNNYGRRPQTIHAWRESSRRIDVRPFVLERPTGERIEVQPDNNVLLIAPLLRINKRYRWERERIASVGSGDDVHLEGVLLHRSNSPFAPSSSGGASTLVAERPRTWTTRRKHGDVTGYYAVNLVGGPRPTHPFANVPASAQVWSLARAQADVRLPCLAWRSFVQIGTRPSLPLTNALAVLAVVAISLAVAPLFVLDGRTWYEYPKIVDKDYGELSIDTMKIK